MAKLECPKCPKTFKTESGLTWHRTWAHPKSVSAPDGVAAVASMDAAGKLGEVAGPGMEAQLLAEAQERIADLEQRLEQREGTIEWANKELTSLWDERSSLKARILALQAEAARPLDVAQAAPRVRDRRAEIVANPELYTGVPEPTPEAVVPASPVYRPKPARLSQSFLETILHSAVGTAVSIGVARAMSSSVHPHIEEAKPDEPTHRVMDDREPPVSNAFVQGDQGHLDPEFLRALMEDLDKILRDPDKMGIVDARTLQIIRG